MVASLLRPVGRDDRSVQFSWQPGALAPGSHRLQVGAQIVEFTATALGGVVTAAGLDHRKTYLVRLDREPLPPVTTLGRPPGEEGAKVATISDCHLGNHRFGLIRKLREPGAVDPFAERCLAAALAEIKAWGPDVLVIKGDLVEWGRPEEYESAARVLDAAELDIPILYVAGNHEQKRNAVDRRPYMDPLGVRCPELEVLDLPGLRLVAADTSAPVKHGPVFPPDRVTALTDALRGAPGGALVCLHHHFHAPVGVPVTTSWPPGFLGQSAVELLDAVAEAHPATLLTSGHTHCNRWARHGPLVMSQVGSTKDGLGVWGAYRAFEGGIIQQARRIEHPDCVRWVDRTGQAVAGLWGHWSPGTMDQRCFAHRWPPPSNRKEFMEFYESQMHPKK